MNTMLKKTSVLIIGMALLAGCPQINASNSKVQRNATSTPVTDRFSTLSYNISNLNSVVGCGLNDGGPATTAQLNCPESVAVDAAGNLYIADTFDNRIRKVSTDGTIATVAGNSNKGYSGDGGPATNAELNWPESVAVDTSGNLYISDSENNRIRKVSTDGTITTVAGNGNNGGCLGYGYSGDGGPATTAQLSQPSGIAVDTSGNLYIADTFNDRIRKVSTEGTITTVAGNSSKGYSGDDGPATGAQLNNPSGVEVDISGSLYIADRGNNRIRKVSVDGTITTVAGNGTRGYSGDGGPATNAELDYSNSIAVDAAGNLYIAVYGSNRIRKISTDGTINTVAGNGIQGYSGDGGPAASAQLCVPNAVEVDAEGNLYIADTFNHRVREVSTKGTISTIAGGGSSLGDGGVAISAELKLPWSVAAETSGNLYIADRGNNRIRMVSASGSINTVAGNGNIGYSGDGGPATNAQLTPWGVAVDTAGNLYIADETNHRIRRVAVDGMITTVAGNGSFGYSGDGGPATSSQLYDPRGIAVDASNNLYIADFGNKRIRKVYPNGTMTTVAGNGHWGYSGDGGPATSAQLEPTSVAVDAAGNLYIADTFNERIRKVSTDGIIITVAGNGIKGYSGDGGPASSAQLYDPCSIAVDIAGNLYIADTYNERIRKVSTDGTINTVAGNGTKGYFGDGGAATRAQLYDPSGIAVDAAGNLYIADTFNHRIRKLTPNF